MEKANRRSSMPASKKEMLLFRPRVNNLLITAAEHSLVVVTGGTGYGKSQAVSSFLEHEKINSTWLHLTQLDNYATRFWEVFAHAMQTQSAALSRFMQGLGFPDTMEKMYQFLRELSQHLYEHGQCVLVLDDFHKIEDASIINFVETLSFTNIENLTIVLITRQPLMIDYTSLQKSGLLSTINGADLRFTPEETREYYSGLGLTFSDEVLQNIQASTEGWPLPIFLIGLHCRKKGSIFADPVACTIPLIHQMMRGDIFDEYNEQEQRAFIKLSVMESVPLELVRIISGSLFADLVQHMRQNMFITYNAGTEDYLFHPLFRTFLQEQLTELPESEIEHVFLLIGDWHLDHGNRYEALEYYGRCHNYARIWKVIHIYSKIGYSGQFAQLALEHIDRFPPEFVESNPLIPVMRGHLTMHVNDIELGHQMFLEILSEHESLPLTETRRQILGEAHLGLSFTCLMRRDYAYGQHFRLAAEYLENGSALVFEEQPFVGNNSAFNLFGTGEGEVDRMLDMFFETMPLGSKAMNGCGYGNEYLAAAEARYFQGETGVAAEYAHKAIYLAQQKKQHDIVYNGFSILGRICFANGDYDGAMSYIQHIRQYADALESHANYGMDDIAEGWFYAKIEHPEKVPGWIVSNTLNMQMQSLISVGKEKIIHALCLYSKKEYYELLALTDYAVTLYERRNQWLLILHMRLMQAMCRYRLGEMDAALESFNAAYDIAYHNNMVMPFIELGNDMRQLLDTLADRLHDKDTEWLAAIQAKASAYGRQRTAVAREYEKRNRGTNTGFASFTEREKEVLTYLCQGLTREEIAGNIGISVNTVKTALKNIFAKLGAINRADAIRIAMDNHIIE